jgi:hypothetical protein
MSKHNTSADELRKKISQLRRDRDAHQMDESDYVDSVVALVNSEVRQVLARLESEQVLLPTTPLPTTSMSVTVANEISKRAFVPLSAIEKEIKKYE